MASITLDIEALKREVESNLASRYPNLHMSLENGGALLKGTFPVLHEGRELDRFAIEIFVPSGFPQVLPTVVESGGKIPRIADRHINADGTACLFLPEEFIFRLKEPLTLTTFILGPVHDYFLGQALVSLGQPWPFGERAHGERGLIDFYKEVFSTDSIDVVKAYLSVIEKGYFKGHWECPCGRGRIIRKCDHRKFLEEVLHKISTSSAKGALNIIGRK